MEMIRVTSAYCSGEGVFLIFRSVLKYVIFPESLPMLRVAAFHCLFSLPSSWQNMTVFEPTLS